MRFKIVRWIFLLTIFLIVVRLWYWQIIRSDDLKALAEGQRISSREILAARGSIFFSDGSSLASSQPVYLIYAQPKIVKDKDKTAEKLAKIFTEKNETTEDENTIEQENLEQDLIKKMSQNLFWVSLGKKVDTQTKKKIEDLKLEGIGFEPSSARFYPEASMSAHLLGFIGSDAYGDDAGYFGLEGFYNGELKGKSGQYIEEKDALGLPILIGDFETRDAKEGKNLHLNIDRTVQYIVEEKLKKGLEKYQAKEASAVVLDPKTGNVLALASFPSYDPAFASDYSKELYKNPITADSYEPGSTFKVLVMAAAINEGVVQEDTKCSSCEGPIRIGGFDIRTWNNKYYPNTTMSEVIVHSDNIGMVFSAKKLGIEKLHSYLSNFGFGNLSGVDLQDEQSPKLRELNGWREIDLATVSFGQGIAVTSIQMVKAIASLANEGKIMEPHVVKLIEDEKNVFEIKPRKLSQPISDKTAKKITQMMVKAVDEGEAKFAKPKGFKIAGKTGTSQIPLAGHYDPDKTIASFVGFAPADDPKFVMLVRFREPTSSIFGSETAAPTFFEITKELFLYYGIPPSE